jgi:hypothetical protein
VPDRELEARLARAVEALEHIGNTIVMLGSDVSLDWIEKRARDAADAARGEGPDRA